MTPSSPRPATLVISRVMRPGREGDYDGWAAGVIGSACSQPGFQAALRLDQAGGMHHLLVQFAGRIALDNWTGQGGQADRQRAADDFSTGRQQVVEGAASHVVLPSEAAARKWKTALVTWAGVVPTLLLVSGVVGWLLPDAPRPVQQILSSVLLTGALTWVILPRVRRWSRFWMLRDSRGRLRTES
ncbi:hypothetical protein [Sphingomonas abaci]|uniref:Antibiotic biosynthesis monooxygenase n=1 Tax=Sphingomonas abaci TaxID=237611 RepID=A0A7W7AMJ7_9SPHN|nr:hypothetical protein [Sphingomonas abaci]MBB4619794.1 hypothetical protein [Sphingomonas abaci]